MRLSVIAFIVLVLIISPAVIAQKAASPVSGATGLFILNTGSTLGAGSWSVDIDAINRDRVQNFAAFGGGESTLDYTQAAATVAYGITDRWEAELSVPYFRTHVNNVISPNPFFDLNSPDVHAWDDSYLSTRFLLSGTPGGPADASKLALRLFVALPTGDSNLTPSREAGAGIEWSSGPWVVNALYADNGRYPASVKNPDYFLAGVGYHRMVGQRMDWMTEIDAQQWVHADFHITDSVDLITGPRIWLDDRKTIAVNLGVTTELRQFGDRHPFGYVFGITLASPRRP